MEVYDGSEVEVGWKDRSEDGSRGGGTGPADPAAAGPIQEHTVKNFFPSLSQRNKVLTYSSK